MIQNASAAAPAALEQVSPENTRQFFGLAAEQVRRELVDLCATLLRSRRIGKNHAGRAGLIPEGEAAGSDPDELADWQSFHEAVAELPAADREMFGLLYYQGLARRKRPALGLSVAAVQQRWQRARLRLTQPIEAAARSVLVPNADLYFLSAAIRPTSAHVGSRRIPNAR